MSGMSRQLLHVRLQNMYKPGKHILVIGITGGGKTSTLFKLIYNLYKQKETVIWRDDANLEFLSFADIIPLKVFLPEGCTLHHEHPNVTYVPFDHTRLSRLFPQLERDSLNVILFDLFTLSHKTSVLFWTEFFQEIYRYKRSRIEEPWAVVIDELNDLAPGTRRGFIQGQLTLSSNIYHSAKKFRKMNLRLVGSTHNYNDLHPPLRAQFNYYLFKAMRRDMVPERFWMYAHKIEALPIGEIWIVDEGGRFQMGVTWSEYSVHHLDRRLIRLSPKRIGLPWSGEVKEPDKKRGSEAKWRSRCLKLAGLLIEHKVVKGYADLAELLGLSDSYVWKLLKSSGDVDEGSVKFVGDESDR